MYIASVTLEPSELARPCAVIHSPSSCLDMDCLYLLQGVETDYRCCQPHALNVFHARDNGPRLHQFH